jgi:AraC family transcriptional regulator
MDDPEIRIETLPAMQVAVFYAYSETPEHDAWQKLVTWAKSHGCWQEAPATRIFGFDNPSTSVGSPNRGYEFWITVGPEIQSDQEVKVKQFSGGNYAVLRCNVGGNPFDIIPASWGKLVHWRETSHYAYGNHQWLEEHLTRNVTNDDYFVLDLYMPIAE